jgi:hypothetical protein
VSKQILGHHVVAAPNDAGTSVSNKFHRLENTAMSDALEERVATALTSDSVTSADLVALVEEVDVAIGTTAIGC